ncbi:hypothetical protein AN948_01050 [Rhodococcus sp. ADH]|nr:hypothetical protein AN948_01050 [Rhodococcus sp. ADH]RGP44410.1 hypothetical protein AWH04_28620 [Rhodococcus erythropolis]
MGSLSERLARGEWFTGGKHGRSTLEVAMKLFGTHRGSDWLYLFGSAGFVRDGHDDRVALWSDV